MEVADRRLRPDVLDDMFQVFGGVIQDRFVAHRFDIFTEHFDFDRAFVAAFDDPLGDIAERDTAFAE